MINFYPGPSRIYQAVPGYVEEAYQLGILGVNHRSDAFMSLFKETVATLKASLKIPKDYEVVFTSSATECWEIIAQSLTSGNSYHLYNGAFGEKWFKYTHRLFPDAISHPFGLNDEIIASDIKVNDDTAVICVTQNETSNSTQVSGEKIAEVQSHFPDQLIAVDATSSMGGIYLPFEKADIWLSSVQKCFGLPAGLGMMVCSPRAVKLAFDRAEVAHYNSLTYMLEMGRKGQTSYTPNALGIYLLKRSLEDGKGIQKIHDKTMKRYQVWSEVLDFKAFDWMVKNKSVRSHTVMTLEGEEKLIHDLKEKAKQAGILLGNGYGVLKNTSFRIANFPAIKKSEIKTLQAFLKDYFK